MMSCILAIAQWHDAEARTSRSLSCENPIFSLFINIKRHAVCSALFCCILGNARSQFSLSWLKFFLFSSVNSNAGIIFYCGPLPFLFSSLTFEHVQLFVILSFRREADENCALLGYYAASSGNFSLVFRNNLSVPFSCRVK